MTTEFSDLQEELDYFLGDEARENAAGEIRDRTYPLPLRVYAWNWSQDLLCQHTPRQRSMTLEIDTGEYKALLPDDFIDVHGVYDEEDEVWWLQMQVEPGQRRYVDEETREYWFWGGEMRLQKDISYDDDRLTMYYWAYYPKVEFERTTEDSDENLRYIQPYIYTPRWAEGAMLHLVAAYCLQPQAIEAADINEYKIEIEAGTPLHNPRAQQAREHLWWWNTILDRVNPSWHR